jgi:predicted RNase H-like nuclease (RuvC/YqgF family)
MNQLPASQISAEIPPQRKTRDEKDVHIDRLKGINQKLRNKIKELNDIVERAIEKANQKKLATNSKHQPQNQDIDYLLKVRDKEIENSEKQIRNNQVEIDKLQAKYEELSQGNNV